PRLDAPALAAFLCPPASVCTLSDSQTDFLTLLFTPHLPYLSAQASQFSLKVFISPLDINNIIHNCNTFGCQPRNHQGSSRAKIRSADSGAGQLIHSVNNRSIPFYFYTGTHTGQFIGVFKTDFKNAFRHKTVS